MAYRPDNVIYLPQAKENLTQEEIEQAFQVIYKAWETERQVRIPWQLLHLSEQQWVMLDAALEELLSEQVEALVQ
jgi:hypothetical protein